MVCYAPIAGWRGPGGRVVFSASAGYVDRRVMVPCGRCIGCRLARSREWAVRIMHELQMAGGVGAFVTLTYDDDHLPDDRSLRVDDLQRFYKRLRKGLYDEEGIRIRHYSVGEYGGRYGRPHYHGCIFGFNFSDRQLHSVTGAGSKIFRSALLERYWTDGFASVGDLTFQSAAYVARYVTKKHLGPQADVHYVDPETGVIRAPEFSVMSKGIGKEWIDKYADDVYPDGFVVVSGKKMKVPRYYRERVKQVAPQKVQPATARAAKRVRNDKSSHDARRRRDREYVQLTRAARLMRGLDQ